MRIMNSNYYHNFKPEGMRQKVAEGNVNVPTSLHVLVGGGS